MRAILSSDLEIDLTQVAKGWASESRLPRCPLPKGRGVHYPISRPFRESQGPYGIQADSRPNPGRAMVEI